MSSTNLDAPSPKLTLATIAIVVGLHALTAVALAAVKAPEMKVEPEKVTPPIEIELITPPPPPPPVEIEEVKIEEKPKLVREVKPKPKAKPVAAPKPKVVKKKQPVEKPKAKQPEQPKPAKQDTTPKKSPDTQLADKQREILAAQAEQARIDALLAQQKEQANAQAIKDAADAKAKAKADAQAKADAKRAQEIADAKAAADAAAAQKAKEAEAAASTGPFTVTNGDWKNKPTFRLSDSIITRLTAGKKAPYSKTYNLTLSLSIDKSGRITNVKVKKPSGNGQIDRRAVSQANSGSFHSSTSNRTAILPISYSVNVGKR